MKFQSLFVHFLDLHLFGEQESVSSLSAINPTDLPYHTLEGNLGAPATDLHDYPPRFDIQIINHPRQDLWNQILPVNRINNSLQSSASSRNCELTRLTQTSTELEFELTVTIFGVIPHLIPTSTGIKHRTFFNPFVVTILQLTSTDGTPLDHQWGCLNFYNPISALKY